MRKNGNSGFGLEDLLGVDFWHIRPNGSRCFGMRCFEIRLYGTIPKQS